MEEIWKDIKGYEGLYQVSNFGRVLSINRTRKGRYNSIVPVKRKFKNFKTTWDGYYDVTLCKDSKLKSFRVHRLVAEAFIPNPNNYPQVNHKDENKTNNVVWINEDGSVDYEKTNLEWCDCKYNNNYSKYKVSHKIECNGITNPSIRECERKIGIYSTTIKHHLKSGKPYKGYLFTYC